MNVTEGWTMEKQATYSLQVGRLLRGDVLTIINTAKMYDPALSFTHQKGFFEDWFFIRGNYSTVKAIEKAIQRL